MPNFDNEKGSGWLNAKTGRRVRKDKKKLKIANKSRNRNRKKK